MNDVQKVISFAITYLSANMNDPEVEAMLAVKLGLVDDEDDYDGNSYDKIVDLIEKARDTVSN